MPFLRHDVTTNDWVIIAPGRGRRPHEYRPQGPADEPGAAACPFCPGHEDRAPGEVYAVRDGTPPDSPGWRLRVVPNKFPALHPDADDRRTGDGMLFRRMGGHGVHEVLVESPEHDRFLADQPPEQVERVLAALHDRYLALMADPRVQAVVVFKNHGERAGASLRHPHWQVIAAPVVPHQMRVKHAVAADYFDLTGRCVYCDLLRAEEAAGERVVAANDRFVAFVPYAARMPYETWVLPREHHSSFGAAAPAQLRSLATLLKDVLGRLHAGVGDPAFNLVVNTAPRGDEGKAYFLWHVQILPRLTEPAGFELGSGMAINTVPPEDAARELRDARRG